MFLAAVVTSLAYVFPAGSKNLYDFTVNLDGYLPILGQPQSSAEVKLVVQVGGLGADADGNYKVTSELIDMKATLGGTPLPFTIDNVKAFFPKTNLTVSPLGRILKTDAPDVQMPVRLPGLDSKRFPDISFVPVEFGAEGMEVGKPWTFKKSFSGSDVTYEVTPSQITDEAATLQVKLSQTTTTFEDAAGNENKSDTGAVRRLATEFSGKGTVVFDRKRNLSRSLVADSEAVTQVTDLKSGETSERRIRTKLNVKLREPGVVLPPLSRPAERHVFGYTLPNAVSGWIDRAEGGMWMILRLLGAVRQ